MIKDILNYEGPIDEIFMVKQATRAISNSGNPYLSLTLQDNSGSIDAKMWSVTDEDVLVLTTGSLVRVDGVILSYRGHPQVKINDFDIVNEKDVDLSKYIPSAPLPLSEMKKMLNDFIESIKDKELHDLTKALIDEHYEQYTTYPAAVTVHHAYLSGLLYHSLSICSAALKLQEQYDILNKDYLIAGSLLHDLGKLKELSSSVGPSYTSEGNLLGHISIGAMMVYNKGIEMKINQEKLDVLTHMILAHHGKYEFGSPKIPATPEAYVLHVLDDLDAKLECIKTNFASTDEGGFTQKITWLENISFFKPTDLDKLK